MKTPVCVYVQGEKQRKTYHPLEREASEVCSSLVKLSRGIIQMKRKEKVQR